MIICISGLSGAGKNTVGSIVARRLGLRLIQFSFKNWAKERGIALMELQREATKDSSLDKQLDRRIVEEAGRGDCVVVTWLAPWMVKNADLRIWVDASEEVRARRIMQRDGMPHGKALAHVRERDANNRERYKRYYDIDIDDRSIFDVTINSDNFTPEQIADIIVAAAAARKG